MAEILQVGREALARWASMSQQSVAQARASVIQQVEYTIYGEAYLLEARGTPKSIENFLHLSPAAQKGIIIGLVMGLEVGNSAALPNESGKPTGGMVTLVEREGYKKALLLTR